MILEDTNSIGEPTQANLFLTAYNTPFKVPPFDKVKSEHFMPAFEEGMKQNEISILFHRKLPQLLKIQLKNWKQAMNC
jgi:peptidyl-dipeptidase Dcp